MTIALLKSALGFRSLRRSISGARIRLDLWRTRRALARLDKHLLKDIGITREQARHEAELTVWDVPANWSDR